MNPRELNITQTISPQGRALSSPKRAVVLVMLCGAIIGAITSGYEFGFLDSVLNSWSVFQIKNVRVIASPPLDEATVRSWMPKWSDKNLLALRVSQVADPIFPKPWVDAVSVRKFFPDTIEIHVTTKRPLAMGILRGESYYFDDTGRVIDRAGPQRWNGSLPVVTRRDDCDFSPGQWSTILAKWPENLRDVLSELWLEKYPHFRVFLSNPRWEVLFSAESWENQLPLLQQLIQYTPSQLREVRKVNLIISKKAVVSRVFSE